MAVKKKPQASGRKTPADKLQLPGKKQKQPKAGPKQPKEDPSLPEEKYYRLKTQAVEDLVTANEENSPPVPASELRKYRSGPQITVADWVKALLLKVWFAGVICYFFIWGLSTFTMNQWDHIVIIAVALGAVTNLLTNNIYRFIAKRKGAYDRWMMVTSPKIWFLPLDLLYALVLVVCVLMTYNAINSAAAALHLSEGTFLGVEPILFGIFVTAWDLLFIGMKHMLQKIFKDARRSVGRA